MLTAEEIFQKHKQNIFKKFELPEEQFNSEFNKWREKRGDNGQSKKDFIWSLYNRILALAPQQAKDELQLYEFQRTVFSQMFVFEIDEGRKSKASLKQVHWCDLNKAALSNFKMHAFFITNGCCPECEKLNGAKMSIEKALNQQPLPLAECTRKTGCVCRYGFEAERDNQGRLIKQ
jgi:hypothetical protein